MKYALSFYIIIVFIYSNSLCGMDLAIEYGEARKKLLVLSIIINNKEVVDHQTICSLAICKECDNTLKKTALLKKEYLWSQTSEKILPEDTVVWHKYGSAYIAVRKNESGEYITMSCYRLHSSFCCYNINTVPLRIPGLEKPFFDTKGNVYLYGLEKGDRWGRVVPSVDDSDITEYYIDNDSLSIVSLAVSIESGAVYTLSRFLSLPNLLKAFLDVEKEEGTRYCDITKVIIPDNYKDFVNYGYIYPSFDNLPTSLITAINQRYKQSKLRY